jgi:hypothetical protein
MAGGDVIRSVSTRVGDGGFGGELDALIPCPLCRGIIGGRGIWHPPFVRLVRRLSQRHARRALEAIGGAEQPPRAICVAIPGSDQPQDADRERDTAPIIGPDEDVERLAAAAQCFIGPPRDQGDHADHVRRPADAEPVVQAAVQLERIEQLLPCSFEVTGG